MEQQQELASILGAFDSLKTSFESTMLSGKLTETVSRHRESGDAIDKELFAEAVAWQLYPNHLNSNNTWGTYYGPFIDWGNGETVPMLAGITDEVIEYWAKRSKEAKHPLLKIRYADLVWDFGCKHNIKKLIRQAAQVMIDATLDASATDCFTHEVTGYQNLDRALQIALKIKNLSRVGQLRDCLISYENRHGDDALCGTWGHCIDLLVENQEKVQLSKEQEQQIISDMENRLARMANSDTVENLKPHHVERASMLLAKYYRRLRRVEDLRRVMGVYANAFVRKAEVNVWVGSSWLEAVYRKLLDFNLHAEAKLFQDRYRKASKKMMEQMPTSTVSVPIEIDVIDDAIRYMSIGDWREVFCRFTDEFVPRRGRQMQFLQESMKGRVLLSLFTPTVVDEQGRTIVKLGRFDQDPEGHLVRHYAQIMNIECFMMRAVIDTWLYERQLSLEDITQFICDSPLFEESRRPIIDSAVRAYLAQDWIVAIHLFVPQIEAAIRQVVEHSGAPTMKPGKHGGLQLRTLDDLLGDEAVEKVFDKDVTFYLRTLLTDQRGWNIRNDVSHGITPIQCFNSKVADRLLHVMLILGEIRIQKAEGESNGESELNDNPVISAS